MWNRNRLIIYLTSLWGSVPPALNCSYKVSPFKNIGNYQRTFWPPFIVHKERILPPELQVSLEVTSRPEWSILTDMKLVGAAWETWSESGRSKENQQAGCWKNNSMRRTQMGQGCGSASLAVPSVCCPVLITHERQKKRRMKNRFSLFLSIGGGEGSSCWIRRWSSGSSDLSGLWWFQMLVGGWTCLFLCSDWRSSSSWWKRQTKQFHLKLWDQSRISWNQLVGRGAQAVSKL